MGIELFDAAEPREEVLAGTLTDAVFATSLDEVVAGSAPEVYKRPEAFFEGTYPSAGLRRRVEEALGRIAGGRADGALVIRLEAVLRGRRARNVSARFSAARDDFGTNPSSRAHGPSIPARIRRPPGQRACWHCQRAQASSRPASRAPYRPEIVRS